MADEHDPLDAVFGDDTAVAAGGEDTQSGADTQSAVGSETQTAREAPGNDSLSGGAADDKIAGDPEVKMVPLAALEEARQRARDAEERLANSTKGADTNTGATEPVGFRDPKEDPQGFVEDIMGSVQLNIVNNTLNVSEKMARKEHGAELVDSVRDWALKRFETDPAFASRILADPDPYEAAIADYKKGQLTEKAGKLDPEILEGLDADEIELLRQHRASKASKTGGDTGTETGGSTATPPHGPDGKFVPRRQVDPAPKPSIATTAASGKGTSADVAAGEGTAFDSAFK